LRGPLLGYLEIERRGGNTVRTIDDAFSGSPASYV
jgi:hypothetical protein